MDEMEVRKILASNLKRLRNQKGLSQLKLSNELHMAFTFINDIENSRKWVSPDTLARLATFFGVSVSELFAEDNNSPNVNPALFTRTLLDEVHKSIDDVLQRFGISIME